MFGLTPERIRPLFRVVSSSTPSALRRIPPLPPLSAVPPMTTAAIVRNRLPMPTVAEPAPSWMLASTPARALHAPATTKMTTLFRATATPLLIAICSLLPIA